MKLYEIPAAIESLVDPETGEVLDTDAFAALQGEWNQKVEWLALGVKNDLAAAAAVKAELDGLKRRQKSHEARAENGKKFLALLLDGKPFETGRVVVSTRKTPASVVVYGEKEDVLQYLQEHHPECVTCKDPEIVRSALKEVLKSEEVPGVRMESGTSLTIK